MKKQQKSLALTVVLLAGTVLMVAFGIVPGVRRLMEEKQKSEDVQKTENVLAAKAAALQSADEKRLDNQIQVAIAALPLVAPYQESLGMMFSLLSQHNVGVSDLKFSSVNSKGKSLIGVNITAVGEYASIKAFLESLDGSVPLVTVSSLNLVHKESQSFSVTISLLVHEDPTPQTIGKASDPLPKISPDLEKTLKTLEEFQSFSPPSSEAPGETTPAGTLFSP